MFARNRCECPPGLSESDLIITHERGQLVQHLRAMVLRTRGQEGWHDLLSKVSEPCRETFSVSTGVFEWVDAGLAAELSLAFYDGQAEELAGERGREAAREQLTTVNGWMLRFLSPSFLLSNLPRFFRFYFKGALLRVEHAGEHHAQLHVWAIGLYPEYWRSGVPGWLEEAMVMTGCRKVGVHYEAPSGEGVEAHHHRYHLRWE
ncbi:MAG: hypothetical protein H6Q00_3502 [Holophagaceae bacterium]|nr:hypothetical protein [Holophagaceae bacterium]